MVFNMIIIENLHVINFRVRKISRNAHKLTQKLTLLKKIL
jgi:hypothetical protein